MMDYAKPLRYLIGADEEDIKADLNAVMEGPYDAPPIGRGPNIAYCNLFHEDPRKDGLIYKPYLRSDDTASEYHEGRIDPRGPGWRKNLDRQYALRKKQGHTCVELDNPDSYEEYFSYVMGELGRLESYGLKVVAKNPLLIPEHAALYVQHPNVVGVIVEKGAGTPEQMEQLRQRVGKPKLPVWFVFFDEAGHGAGWRTAQATARYVAPFSYMGVTYSAYGEYVSSSDLVSKW